MWLLPAMLSRGEGIRMCGFCQGACVVFVGGVCVVFAGGHAWSHFAGGSSCIGYDEIRSMNGQYTSYCI